MGMKISIVTPSYNQVGFVSRTLDSVATQNYADYEHLIYDGLSDDGSHEIISQYAEGNANVHYVREADRGQVHAINKGFAAATGDVITWINSDDYYASPDALSSVAGFFRDHPGVDVVYGRGNRVDAAGKRLSEAYIHPDGTDLAVALQHSLGLLQPSLFFRKGVYEAIGGLDETYNLQLDYEYWIRMVQAGFTFKRIDKLLSNATVHDDAKSTGQRLPQLNECLHLVSSKFGYVPRSWVSRYAEFYLTRLDAKVVKGIELDTETSAQKHEIERALASHFNHTDAAGRVFDQQQAVGPVADVIRYMDENGISPTRPRRVVITSFDSHYYHQGLNLIASLHRTSFDTVDEIIVYSLGLEAHEMDALEALEKVKVLQYPHQAADIFPGYLNPRHRAYKPMAIRGPEGLVGKGGLVLWMDAGLSALDDVAGIFSLIESGDFFIADHDDKSNWPFYNVNFMHPSSQDAFNPSNEELLAPHMCSCMVGYRSGGRFQHLIDEAFEYGCKPEIVLWPKSIPAKEKYKPVLSPEQTRFKDALLDGELDPREYPREALRKLFPYYGHRTQSIYSILACRHKAPTYSGRIYRRSNDISSRASMVNWNSTAGDTRSASSSSNLQGQDADVVVYHHRGVYNNLNGMRYKRKGDAIFILGNGPSLKDCPFDKLRDYATIGMNAAYRFWDRSNFYPTYYCCLDTVVLESHKSEIRRLIAESDTNGIRKFLLRKVYLDFYPELAANANVLFLEDIAQDAPMFALDKITTGSFSLLFAIFLGYRDVFLMGVDLNYVEKLPEAELKGGRVLEIKSDPEGNPNYFFDDYQKAGDRYNPPNRHPNMHVRSWNNIKDSLGDFPVRVRNLNRESALRCFEFDDIHKVLKVLGSPFSDAEIIAQRTLQDFREKAFWRQSVLREIEACARENQHDKPAMPAAPQPRLSSATHPPKVRIRAEGVEASVQFESVSAGIWNYVAQAADASGYIRANFNVSDTVGRGFICCARLQSDTDMNVELSFGRMGVKTPYEGTKNTIELSGGTPRLVRLSRAFLEEHRGLKLQVKVVGITPGERARLRFDSVSVVEDLPSLEKRFEGQMRLSVANRLYREEDYSAAMGIYVHLHGQHGLRIYASNALRCARKLDMDFVRGIDDLVATYA